eukprot:6196460-Pleurochrysis_carterae.AAC.1
MHMLEVDPLVDGDRHAFEQAPRRRLHHRTSGQSGTCVRPAALASAANCGPAGPADDTATLRSAGSTAAPANPLKLRAAAAAAADDVRGRW